MTSTTKASVYDTADAAAAVAVDCETGNNNNNTTEQQHELEEPLLSFSISHDDEYDGSDTTPTRASKLVFFGTGSVAAVTSQWILGAVLWNDQLLSANGAAVIWFSLQWSFWTVAMTFASMFALTSYYSLNNGDIQLQLEVFHVMGALSAVSLTWLLNDVFSVRTAFLDHYKMIVAAASCLLYVAFMLWIVLTNSTNAKNKRLRGQALEEQHAHVAAVVVVTADSSLGRTFQMVAALLGLVVGSCSQFLLAACMWDNHMQTPVIGNVVLFSFLWSGLTVIMTSAVCCSLQYLTNTTHHHHTGRDDDDEEATDNNKTNNSTVAHHQQRLQLRMEAAYVNGTLIGICLAWVLMDLFLDMVQQILPSLGLLVLSLAAFRAILHCFPEEACLDEDDSVQEQAY